MSHSSYSIANVLRQVRGARNAAARAEVRYGRSEPVCAKLKQAQAALNKAEAYLLAARRLALAKSQLRATVRMAWGERRAA